MPLLSTIKKHSLLVIIIDIYFVGTNSSIEYLLVIPGACCFPIASSWARAGLFGCSGVLVKVLLQVVLDN